MYTAGGSRPTVLALACRWTLTRGFVSSVVKARVENFWGIISPHLNHCPCVTEDAFLRVSLTFLAKSSIGRISISIEWAFRMPPQWSCVNRRSRGICNHPSQRAWSSFITPATKWTILKITWMDSFFWCYITTWKYSQPTLTSKAINFHPGYKAW